MRNEPPQLAHVRELREREGVKVPRGMNARRDRGTERHVPHARRVFVARGGGPRHVIV